MASHPLRIASLFSGVGGLDLGVARALEVLGVSHRTVLYVEGEIYAARVLARRMEEGRIGAAPIWSDVRSVGSIGVAADIALGGFPCQDISTAGKGEGIAGERSGLWFDMIAAALSMGCRYLFLENVAAISTRGLDAVLGSLAEAGFDAEWCCLRASDVGAPHKRDRWFCLAYARELHRGRGECGAEEGVGSRGQRRRGSPERGAEVADGNGQRQPGLAKQDQQPKAGVRASHRDHADGHDLPAWPPGPGDRDGWARVLEQRPDLAPSEPSVRRVAHGASNRVDRLRALGNAVVPDQACVAFMHLWSEVHREIEA